MDGMSFKFTIRNTVTSELPDLHEITLSLLLPLRYLNQTPAIRMQAQNHPANGMASLPAAFPLTVSAGGADAEGLSGGAVVDDSED